MRLINLLVLHCAATANGQPIVRGAVGTPSFRSTPAVIDSWHAERGFQRTAPTAKTFNPDLPHIGYHFVITTDGAVFTGRAPEEIGAHALHANANSLGICMVGTDAFTPKQWTALRSLVTRLCAEFKIPMAFARRAGDRLFDGVCGHRDVSPDTNHNGRADPWEWLKICPGFDVQAWLNAGMTPDQKHVVE
jgi:hypothetical protein